jgi:exosortase E/protease (VPEID-CTERM system)
VTASGRRDQFDSIGGRISIRWFCLAALLVVEVLWGTNVLSTPDSTTDSGLLALLVWHGSWLLDFSLAMAAATLLIMGRRLRAILGSLAQQSGYRWWPWLVLHVVGTIALLRVSWPVLGPVANPASATVPWLIVWLVLAILAVVALLLAAAPAARWRQLARTEWRALLAGGVAGIAAWGGGLLAQGAWDQLTGITLWSVQWVLSTLTSDVYYNYSAAQVGTSSFVVEIDQSCSGYEGVALVLVFVAIYLWLFRSELRFPRALLLFPVGVFAIWIANVLRIATLILIGDAISPEIALGGFHSQAGWIGFITVALGLIVLSHRHLLAPSAVDHRDGIPGHSTLALALIGPLLAQLAFTMVASAFSVGFAWLYPLGVIATGAVLWHFRSSYRAIDLRISWQAVGIGVLVFALWVVLVPHDDAGGIMLPGMLAQLPPWMAGGWLLFRIVGSVVTVPVAEELAFRGYLIRKLVSRDFENVRPGHFTWLSFVVSSLLFGLLHDSWIAGTLAGAGFALALYRRGQLGDAIVAHITANALIACTVLALGRWGLWA